MTLSPLPVPKSDSPVKGSPKFTDDKPYPCVVCGRPASYRYSVHLCGGGDVVVAPGGEHDGGEAACLGSYPVGSECLRRFPELRPYVVETPSKR